MTVIARMDPRAITHLTIHCTATPEGRPNTAEEVTAWDIQRFGQPSYHHVICLDGSDHVTLRDDQRGAHTGGHNTGNIGISYVGGTSTMNTGATPKDTRTEAQTATIRRLCLTYKVRFPRLIILGHREWPGVAKACPSFDVTAWRKTVGL